MSDLSRPTSWDAPITQVWKMIMLCALSFRFQSNLYCENELQSTCVLFLFLLWGNHDSGTAHHQRGRWRRWVFPIRLLVSEMSSSTPEVFAFIIYYSFNPLFSSYLICTCTIIDNPNIPKRWGSSSFPYWCPLDLLLQMVQLRSQKYLSKLGRWLK